MSTDAASIKLDSAKTVPVAGNCPSGIRKWIPLVVLSLASKYPETKFLKLALVA